MKQFDEEYWHKRLRECGSHEDWERVNRLREKAFEKHTAKRRAHFEKYSWMYTENMGAKPTEPPYRVLWDAGYKDYSARTGKPYCRFLSKKLGFRVSAKVRDAIWADYYNCYERRDNPKLKVHLTWQQIESQVGFDYNEWRRNYK